MNLRQQIIERLNKPYKQPDYENGEISHYEQLKSCLNINFPYDNRDHKLNCYEVDQFSNSFVDNWFAGVIKSLYYKPNNTALVLVGKRGIGKTEFFRRLLPIENDRTSDLYFECWASLDLPENIYSHLLANFEFSKGSLDLPNQDDFKVSSLEIEFANQTEDFYHNEILVRTKQLCDKRLASYCCTTNKWVYPARKNYIVLNVESINQELFNLIDKELLWIDIYNRFKNN